MADGRKDMSGAKQCCVVGRRSDFGLPPEDSANEADLIVYSCSRTRQGIRTESVPVPLVEALPFDDNTVVTGLVNVREAVTCRLEAPFEKRSKVEKVLPTLLDIKLPFPVEECVYVFLGFRQESEVTSALGVAARSSDIKARLEALIDAGADPLILDHEGLALWTQSIIERPDADGATIRVVLQMGSTNWSLVLGNGFDYLGSYNVVPSDLAHVRRIIKATVATLKKSGQGEENSTGRSPNHENSVAIQVLLCGWGANEQETVEQFKHTLGVDDTLVEVLDQPVTFLARGLAQRSFEEGPLRCNLRTGAFEHPAVAEQAFARARVGGVALVLAGAILFGTNIAISELATERERAMDSKLQSMRSELIGYSIKALGSDAQDKVRSETIDRIRRLEPFLKMKNRESLRPVLYDVTALASEKGVEYNSLSIMPDGVEIKGSAPSLAAAVSLREYLESKGYKSELHKQAGELEGERIGFVLNSAGETQ